MKTNTSSKKSNNFIKLKVITKEIICKNNEEKKKELLQKFQQILKHAFITQNFLKFTTKILKEYNLFTRIAKIQDCIYAILAKELGYKYIVKKITKNWRIIFFVKDFETLKFLIEKYGNNIKNNIKYYEVDKLLNKCKQYMKCSED